MEGRAPSLRCPGTPQDYPSAVSICTDAVSASCSGRGSVDSCGASPVLARPLPEPRDWAFEPRFRPPRPLRDEAALPLITWSICLSTFFAVLLDFAVGAADDG